jgi:hypothetical protein
LLKLIEECGKTLKKEDIRSDEDCRYSEESKCSICLGEWEAN